MAPPAGRSGWSCARRVLRRGYAARLVTHAEARLCEGKLKGNKILCPLHGAAFDVRDGSALTRPASIALKTYAVEISGDDILLQEGGD